jgi:hypothetical protein
MFAIDYADAARAVRACWEAATAGREVRHEVWEPFNRNKARCPAPTTRSAPGIWPLSKRAAPRSA